LRDIDPTPAEKLKIEIFQSWQIFEERCRDIFNDWIISIRQQSIYFKQFSMLLKNNLI